MAVHASSGFGVRRDPISGQVAVHKGLDMPVAQGTPVYAAAGGVVRYAGRRGGYGLMIEIAHPDGTRTRYAHLSQLLVSADQPVSVSAMIGRTGSTGRSTGPHLHFEYLVHDQAVNPAAFLTGRAAPMASAPRMAARNATEPFRSAYARARDTDRDEACARDRLPEAGDLACTAP